VNFKNQYVPGNQQGGELQARETVPLSRETALELVSDAFTSAVERHIEVGDALQVMIITKDGVKEIISPLKKD
jgi:20S proteasome subunit beta 6